MRNKIALLHYHQLTQGHTLMKAKLFLIAVVCLGLFLFALPQTTSAQNRNAYEIIQDTNHNNGGSAMHSGGGAVGTPVSGVITPPADPDNPPDFRDPNDPRKILDYNCGGRTKITTPGRIYGWNCTASMSCSCSMTYRDDNGVVRTCAASPMSRSLSGSGGDSNRNTCISEADTDLDSARDSFFAECQAALANCPP